MSTLLRRQARPLHEKASMTLPNRTDEKILEAVKELAGNAYKCGNADAPSFCCPPIEEIYGFKTLSHLISQKDAALESAKASAILQQRADNEAILKLQSELETVKADRAKFPMGIKEYEIVEKVAADCINEGHLHLKDDLADSRLREHRLREALKKIINRELYLCDCHRFDTRDFVDGKHLGDCPIFIAKEALSQSTDYIKEKN